jgi:hypothetical protein
MVFEDDSPVLRSAFFTDPSAILRSRESSPRCRRPYLQVADVGGLDLAVNDVGAAAAPQLLLT